MRRPSPKTKSAASRPRWAAKRRKRVTATARTRAETATGRTAATTPTPTARTAIPTAATHSSALQRCVAPVEAERFFGEHWEREPLLVPRDEEGRFLDLLSIV